MPSNTIAEGVRCEELEKIIIDANDDKYFQVGVQLPPWEKEELVTFLKENIDVFTWSAYEAPEVDLSFIFYHLNVNPFVTPKKQLPWRSLKEHFEAVKEEVIGVLSQATKNKTYTPKNICSSVSKDRSHGEYLA